MNTRVLLFTACICVAMFSGNEATGVILKAKALLAAKAAKLGLIKHAIISKHHYAAAPAPETPHLPLHQVPPAHPVAVGSLHENIGSLWQSASSAVANKATKIKAGISSLNPIPYLKRLHTTPVPAIAVPVFHLLPNTAYKHYNVVEYYPVKTIEILQKPVHHQPEPAKPYPPAPAYQK